MSALALSRGDRRRIAALIDALIDTLDLADGDCELEFDDEDRCAAGDDGCGVFAHPSAGFLWGSEEDGVDGLAIYGLDQSLGPINERAVMLARSVHLADTSLRRRA